MTNSCTHFGETILTRLDTPAGHCSYIRLSLLMTRWWCVIHALMWMWMSVKYMRSVYSLPTDKDPKNCPISMYTTVKLMVSWEFVCTNWQDGRSAVSGYKSKDGVCQTVKSVPGEESDAGWVNHIKWPWIRSMMLLTTSGRSTLAHFLFVIITQIKILRINEKWISK